MARPSDLYAVVAIVLIIMLGLGIMYLNINGVLDNITSLMALVIPAAIIVAAVRLSGFQDSDSY